LAEDAAHTPRRRAASALATNIQLTSGEPGAPRPRARQAESIVRTRERGRPRCEIQPRTMEGVCESSMMGRSSGIRRSSRRVKLLNSVQEPKILFLVQLLAR